MSCSESVQYMFPPKGTYDLIDEPPYF